MTVQTIDNGNETIVIDTNAPDARSIMLASASAIAAVVIDTEGKLAESAKAWGQALFRAVYVDKAGSLDSMIGDSKVAAGWNVLAQSEAGRKAKGRMEVYFSNARLVAETFEKMEDDKRGDILAGLSSIHYVAGQLRKAKADADKAAKKEADRVAAEAAAEKAKAEAAESNDNLDTREPGAAPVSLADMILSLTVALDTASDDDLAAVYDDMNALVAAYDARVNAAADQTAQAA